MTTVSHSSKLVHSLTGVSYRQLNYWAQRGYLRPVATRPGSGRMLEFSDLELKVAELMARLVVAGLTPAAAERVARGEPQIGAGIWVLVTDPAGTVTP